MVTSDVGTSQSLSVTMMVVEIAAAGRPVAQRKSAAGHVIAVYPYEVGREACCGFKTHLFSLFPSLHPPQCAHDLQFLFFLSSWH
jgi:hypothetical protein